MFHCSFKFEFYFKNFAHDIVNYLWNSNCIQTVWMVYNVLNLLNTFLFILRFSHIKYAEQLYNCKPGIKILLFCIKAQKYRYCTLSNIYMSKWSYIYRTIL